MIIETQEGEFDGGSDLIQAKLKVIASPRVAGNLEVAYVVCTGRIVPRLPFFLTQLAGSARRGICNVGSRRACVNIALVLRFEAFGSRGRISLSHLSNQGRDKTSNTLGNGLRQGFKQKP